jgi:hypothetical protein
MTLIIIAVITPLISMLTGIPITTEITAPTNPAMAPKIAPSPGLAGTGEFLM